MKHNFRNSFGQFAIKPVDNTLDPTSITPGRLYGYKGIGVRAVTKTQGKWLVCFHKTLMGLVEAEELSKLSKAEVDSYLSRAAA